MESPCLRLFLSVDIVGSTEFKSKQASGRGPGERPKWLEVFTDFHNEFHTYLLRNIEVRSASPFNFWKALGDELLFYVQVDSLDILLAALTAFEKAIREYREEDKHQYKGNRLSLKGTAWVAGFPVINAELSLGPEDRKQIDFIGPSIDAGFRVSKFSTSNHLCVNAELAYILLECLKGKHLNTGHKDQCGLPLLENRLFFHGLESLKGVVDGKPYPIFYIEQNTPAQTHFDRMIDVSAVDPVTAFDYIEAFFGDVDQEFSFCRPYILGPDQQPVFGKMPPTHKDHSVRPSSGVDPETEAIALDEEKNLVVGEGIDFDQLVPLETPSKVDLTSPKSIT